MISAFLLGNGDHYTNRVFKVVFWRVYVSFVENALEGDSNVDSSMVDSKSDSDTEEVLVDKNDEKVILSRGDERIIALSRVNDYVYRPLQYSTYALYDFLQTTDVGPSNGISLAHMDDDAICSTNSPNVSHSLRSFAFVEGHPNRRTHAVYAIANDLRYTLNFVGGMLPRRTGDDRERYCMVMLVLFKRNGWRSARDLKDDAETWEEAFQREQFASSHRTVMDNMNILYECQDERDDFSAQRRKAAQEGRDGMISVDQYLPGFIDIKDIDEQNADYLNQQDIIDLLDLVRTADGGAGGYAYALAKTSHLFDEIRLRGQRSIKEAAPTLMPMFVSSDYSPQYWHQILEEERQGLLDTKRQVIRDALAKKTIPEQRVFHVGNPEGSVYWTDSSQSIVPYASPSEYAQHDELIQEIFASHTLNDAQRRAFALIAYRLYRPQGEQLLMYIGGMGGTGKSQILHALRAFLRRKNEDYRVLVTAPTGTAARLIDGSTYHSVMGFSGLNDYNPSATVLSNVRERLQYVDVLFLDEISMVSCNNLFKICAQMSKASDAQDLPFGGKHVVVAGDFGQLPPVGNAHNCLYSHFVNSSVEGLKLSEQRAVIGKALWHLFTTVVILSENMRQLDPADNVFRTALTNLRYKASTASDIALLRTRISSNVRGRVHVGDPMFRDVSVITPQNVDRDAMNVYSSERFAQDTGQELTSFYSRDSWNVDMLENESTAAHLRVLADCIEPTRSGNSMDERLREFLWNLPPGSTGHRAGILRLCYGMPIMIKNNEATELCVTNGAEGIVCGWDFDFIDDTHKHLKTLFVQLVSPPRQVHIGDLPLNVIPLVPAHDRIYYKISKKKKLPFTREQIPILPNFAMTDFASQGRTRSSNVVDLRKCRSHQSVYTCLSRSSSLSGTIILAEFKLTHFLGGAERDLMCEFRELEILSDVTMHQFNGDLPFDTHALSRKDIVAKYQAWKGLRFVPQGVPAPLNWSRWPTEELIPRDDGPTWGLWVHDLKEEKVEEKRPADVEVLDQRPPKKMRIEVDVMTAKEVNSEDISLAPRPEPSMRIFGCVWDAKDWSCAYDTWMHFLWNTYRERNINWYLNGVVGENDTLALCLSEFEQLQRIGRNDLDTVRNKARDVLSCLRPALFPRHGPMMVDIEDVFATIFPLSTSFSVAERRCTACTYTQIYTHGQLDSVIFRTYPALWQNTAGCDISLSTTALLRRVLHGSHTSMCPSCAHGSSLQLVRSLVLPIPLIVFALQVDDITTPPLVFDTIITTESLPGVTWSLTSIIYFTGNHFTSRYFDCTGRCWFHDSADRSRLSVEERGLTQATLRKARGAKACMVIYTLMS